MADQMSVEQIAELREAFALFDKDGNGFISSEELGAVMQSVGQPLTPEEVQAMLGEADIDRNGTIDFPEFLSLAATKINNKEDIERELLETFRFYDVNGAGMISPSNLQYAMAKLGAKLTPEEADEMIREADLDMDGYMNYEEFRRMMAMQ
eukprot:PhM_4_TR3720/c0_g1_i1/m.66238/K02183/CALM; calmodulin